MHFQDEPQVFDIRTSGRSEGRPKTAELTPNTSSILKDNEKYKEMKEQEKAAKELEYYMKVK